MPRVVTLSELKDLGPKSINESRSIIQKAFSSSENRRAENNSVFISYSSKDIVSLPTVLEIISGHGGMPYVDKADERLPEKPNKETASILKGTILSTRKFIVFVTSNTKDSKWVPWELGIGDGTKRDSDIALFPSTENRNEINWYEQEYFGLYRRIVWGRLEGYNDNVWMVYDHEENTAIELSKWIRG